jgi:fructosamine-3-kinase
VQTGSAREINFPLHQHTANVGHVGAMIESLLAGISREIRVRRNVSDGDVLQAMCMALAIRMHMVAAAPDTVRTMVAATLEQADEAVAESTVQVAGSA